MRILFVITLLIAFSISKPTLAMEDGYPDMVPYQTVTPDAEEVDSETCKDYGRAQRAFSRAHENYCKWVKDYGENDPHTAEYQATCQETRKEYVACYKAKFGKEPSGVKSCQRNNCN